MEIEWPKLPNDPRVFEPYRIQDFNFDYVEYKNPCTNCPCNKNGAICHCTLPYHNTIT